MRAGTSLRVTVRDLIGYIKGLRMLLTDGQLEAFNRTIKPLILLTDAQSSYCTIEEGVEGSHSIRVARLARRVGEILGLRFREVLNLECAALFHDIGKLLIERHLFLKNARLTHEEFEKVKFHVTAGVSIIYQFDFLNSIVPAVYDHHERWDGSGYPNKKAGERISLEGRILSLADAYDAMTTPRPYRGALGSSRAKEEIEKNAGTQFDPEIAKIFIREF